MYRFLAGVIVTLLLVMTAWYFVSKKEEKQEIQFNSALIQQQISQVGKLIVTEGNFSQVMSYSNTRKNYFDIFSSNKKALVIINAKVTVGYDLRQLQTLIDEETKTVRITNIPPPEINIYPDLSYYDVTQDYFNKFGAADYNKIKDSVHKMMEEKVAQSNLKSDAKQRLLSELSKIYILTNSMGWTLAFEETVVSDLNMLERLDLK
ncbi:hypothetical protein ADIS_1490 [Lunatimonas lonarensis]|uniref:DUF4230 domain-containing protein n=1 Tax=Lunatimonas lonarensis TaxID=1232681 RepID=R7ZUX8_9BACT|nr:DUF4230 domain-containing protein [Lunatimonas lonarensis]EON77951.1 hypothetical protein ADIS_1490 [Lunatimonas lonarensis]